ncbi:MAG: hypothetical protein WBD40_10220 [Tepidisphaeraceae bacterium]
MAHPIHPNRCAIVIKIAHDDFRDRAKSPEKRGKKIWIPAGLL